MLEDPGRFLFVFFGIEAAFQTHAGIFQVWLLQRTRGMGLASRCGSIPDARPVALFRGEEPDERSMPG
jgi:hypothetical protein